MLRKFPSKLGVIVLSIVLITGISLLTTLQIRVQGQEQEMLMPTMPSSPTTPPCSTKTPGTMIPKPAPPTDTNTTTEPSATDTTTRMIPIQTEIATTTSTADADDGAVNQSAMVMIPQCTMEMIMNNIQDAMTAVSSDNKDDAMTALNSVAQELKSAADALGVTVDTTTNG